VLTMSPVVTATDERPIVARAGQCSAHTGSGAQCRRQAVKGATVCYVHGGAAPQVKAAAARRLAEREAVASLADVEVQPIENPLVALAEVAEEQRAFMRFAAGKVAELEGSLVGRNDAGTEHIRAVVAMYERAADRTARLLADWTRLGFDERMVRLAERQADLVEAFVLAVVDDLHLTEEQAERVPAAVVEHLPMLVAA
jgi:hypothetical protein